MAPISPPDRPCDCGVNVWNSIGGVGPPDRITVELGGKVFTGVAVTTATKLVDMGIVDFTRVKVVGTALERVPGRVTAGVGTSSLLSERY